MADPQNGEDARLQARLMAMVGKWALHAILVGLIPLGVWGYERAVGKMDAINAKLTDLDRRLLVLETEQKDNERRWAAWKREWGPVAVEAPMAGESPTGAGHP